MAVRVSPATDATAFMVPLDTQERLGLCDLFDELGPSVPTLLEGWTAHDLAAHLVLRERDLVAGPCLVLPGPFQRFAEQRRVRLAKSEDFTWLVSRIRCGLWRTSTSSLFIMRTSAEPIDENPET